MTTYKNITVYCGSHFGNDGAFASLAARLGEALGKGGFHMIYGGGTVGLMGLAADAAMAAGGRVTGIIPRVFIEKEQAHRGITELLEVPDMITRKQKLIESGDAFIVLPGGIGTLEELADTFSHYRIYAAPGSRPPILIANINGIYDPLQALFPKLATPWIHRKGRPFLHPFLFFPERNHENPGKMISLRNRYIL